MDFSAHHVQRVADEILSETDSSLFIDFLFQTGTGLVSVKRGGEDNHMPVRKYGTRTRDTL